jgi:hypothetical protein
MVEREIERTPQVPELGVEVIQLLTKLCFRRDHTPTRADLLFVFSTATAVEVLAQEVQKIIIQGLTPRVFVTGGTPQFSDYAKIGRTESELFFEHLDPKEFPSVEFFSERASTDTRTNVTEALKVLDFSTYEKVIFIFKAHAAGRGYLTLRKFLPNTQLLQATYTPVYPEIGRVIARDTWQETEFGCARVWGEFLRIQKYGERGDIAYDTETQELVSAILQLIK